MMTPDTVPVISETVAFYIDKKDEHLLVAYDVSSYYVCCRIDAEAYAVVLLCNGTNTVKDIAEKCGHDEKEVKDLIKTLCERNVIEIKGGI